MNKVILGLILAVCILGMALVMLNERLGRKNDTASPSTATAETDAAREEDKLPEKVETPGPRPPVLSPSEMVEAVRGQETTEAEEALAPPVVEHIPTPSELRAKQEEEALKLAAEVQLYPEGAESVARELEQTPQGRVITEEPKPAPKPAPEPKSAPKSQPAAPRAEAPAPPAAEKPAPPRVEKTTPAEKPVAKPAPQPEKPARTLATPEKIEQKPAQKPATAGQPLQKPVEKPASTDKSKASAGNDITKFVIYARENGATVRVTGNSAMAWRSMVLDNPPRVVVDLEGKWKFPAHPGVPKNDLVNDVRIGQGTDNKTRVVIDLKEKPKSAKVLGAKAGDGFDVRVDK